MADAKMLKKVPVRETGPEDRRATNFEEVYFDTIRMKQWKKLPDA